MEKNGALYICSCDLFVVVDRQVGGSLFDNAAAMSPFYLQGVTATLHIHLLPSFPAMLDQIVRLAQYPKDCFIGLLSVGHVHNTTFGER